MKKTVKKIFVFLSSAFLVFLSFFIKRNNNMIAFGSWCGKQYSDNSKYLFEYMLKSFSNDYHFIWVGEINLKNQMPNDDRITVVKKNSFVSIISLLKCKYMFCSQHAQIDLCSFNVFEGATVTYLHHGYPIKRFGDDALGYIPRSKDFIRDIYHRFIPAEIKYDYFVTSSSEQAEIFLTSLLKHGCSLDKCIASGTPRNDLYLNTTKEEKEIIRKELCNQLGIEFSNTIILYLPTFRRKSNNTESLYFRDCNERQKIQNILNNYNAILIEKGHFVDESSIYNNLEEAHLSNYIHLNSKGYDVQQLMIAADVLISDFSSAFVDFLLLDKPIIHYLYDYESYRDFDSGLYYSESEFGCGHVAFQYSSFLVELENALHNDLFKDLRKERINRFLEFERGNACQTIVSTIIK